MPRVAYVELAILVRLTVLPFFLNEAGLTNWCQTTIRTAKWLSFRWRLPGTTTTDCQACVYSILLKDLIKGPLLEALFGQIDQVSLLVQVLLEAALERKRSKKPMPGQIVDEMPLL